MAAPRLRLRRGSSTPVGNVTTALSGEPFVDTTNDNFYIADSASTFIHVGGTTYTSRVDEFLTAADTSGGTVALTEATANGTDTVTLKAPDSVTTSYGLTFPAAKPGTGGAYLLEYDQATEQLSFVTSGAGETIETTTSDVDASFYLTFVDSDNGTAASEAVFTDGELSYNPNTDILTVSGEVDAASIDVGSTGIDIAGSTSGTVTLVTAAVAGTTTITLPATTGTVVTTGDSGTVTSTMIADGTIVNADINASAAIEFSKLEALSDANILIGNASNVATSVATSGDVSLSNAGVFAITAGAIVNADVNASAAIDFSKLAALTAGNILVGNASNVATSVAASGDVTISNTGAFSVNSVQANSVALGTDTTGNYVASITAGAGLTGSAASEGSTPTLNVGAGEGITVNADTVQIKNAANFSNNTVLKWDNTNEQFVNSIITDDGSTVVVTGNLTVNGTTTTVNTTNTVVSDTLLELANGTTAATSDAGLIIERGSTGDNVFIGFDEGVDLFVAGTTTITGSGTDAGATPIGFLSLQYLVNDDSVSGGSAGNQAVIGYLAGGAAPDGATAGRYLQNITVDAGTY
jgi:hypothetical protein